MAKEPGTGDYQVGYAKPPKHSQWKKGTSGNPSGKKSKELTLSEKLKAIADEEILVHKNGQTIAMTNMEAAIYAAFAKAQSGNPQVLKILLQELGATAIGMSAPPAINVTDADLAVLQTHADWVSLIEQAQAELAETANFEMEEDEVDDDAHDDH